MLKTISASDTIVLYGTRTKLLAALPSLPGFSVFAPNKSAVVVDGAKANIKLENVRIDVSKYPLNCAFQVTNRASVTLTLSGENFLSSGFDRGGLEVGAGNTLSISGTMNAGKLVVVGGKGAAGIGGGSGANVGSMPLCRDSGSISISSGMIDATGGDSGAGIGGGTGGVTGLLGGNGNTIVISGGTVVARGGNRAAGIGGGRDGIGGGITISGGTVDAAGYGGGAGIGGGHNGAAGTINIKNGTVIADGKSGGMDIGYGDGKSGGGNIFISGGSVRPMNGGDQVKPQPHSDATSAKVYLNTLTVGATPVKNAMVSSPMLDRGVLSYGAHDVTTDGSGVIYFWLPAGANGNVTVSAGGARFGKDFTRPADNGTMETLLLLDGPGSGTDPGTTPGTTPGTDPGTNPGTNPGPVDPDAELRTDVALNLTDLGLKDGVLHLIRGRSVDMRITTNPVDETATFSSTGLPYGLRFSSKGNLYGAVDRLGEWYVILTAVLPNGKTGDALIRIEVSDYDTSSSGGCATGAFGAAMLLALSAAALTARRSGKREKDHA